MRALNVGSGVAWGRATRARGPVHVVDLPHTDIVGTVRVVVLSVSVTARLVRSNALAAGLQQREFRGITLYYSSIVKERAYTQCSRVVVE